jgi:hypothetical protein
MGAASIGVPHSMQNRPRSAGTPQAGQARTATGVPHSRQNLAPDGSSTPQAWHVTDTAHLAPWMRPSWHLALPRQRIAPE